MHRLVGLTERDRNHYEGTLSYNGVSMSYRAFYFAVYFDTEVQMIYTIFLFPLVFHIVGQDEIIIVLECLKDTTHDKGNLVSRVVLEIALFKAALSASYNIVCFLGDGASSIGESSVPRDIFCHFNTVYEEAGKVSYEIGWAQFGNLNETLF